MIPSHGSQPMRRGCNSPKITPDLALSRPTLLGCTFREPSRERERVRVYRKCPPYGAAIARQRARGRVPIPVDGYHVTIAFQPQYRIAAPSRDLWLPMLEAHLVQGAAAWRRNHRHWPLWGLGRQPRLARWRQTSGSAPQWLGHSC